VTIEPTVIRDIRLSWQGVALAPLVVPFILASLLTISSPGMSPLFGFLFFFVVGSFVSYSATIFLLLPCLYLISRIMMLKWHWVCLCGIVLGIVMFFPMAWIGYRSSGPDSGPPIGTFAQYLWRTRSDGLNWFFPIAGLVTSLAYWGLAHVPSCCRDRRRLTTV